MFREKNNWKWLLLIMLILTLFVCVGCEVDDDDDDVIIIDDSVNFCLEDITDLDPGDGPFSTTSTTLRVRESWFSYATVNVYLPRNIPSGCKLPIVHLANGTTAMCYMYEPVLENLAEFGFIAACYEDSNTGQGDQAITAVKAVMSNYSNIVDADKIGFTGHSQGGGATYMAVYLAEEEWGSSKTITGLAMEPASGFGDSPITWQNYYDDIDSPMSMFNGVADTLVPEYWVEMAYDALPNDITKIWYTATGLDSTHIPVPNTPTQEMSIPWFRWMLLGDSNACQEFKDLPNSIRWSLQEQRNVPSCY